MAIGNDVVDLTAPRARGKAADPRFVARVFSERERKAISASSTPDLTLWVLWAGKEAAYKVARKIHSGVVFSHRHFEVRLIGRPELPPSGEVRLRGLVNLPSGSALPPLVPVVWEISDTCLHCTASSEEDEAARTLGRVVAIDASGQADTGAFPLTERELSSARSPESRAVRELAKRLAAEQGAGEVEIVREPDATGFGPPRLFRRGAEGPLEGWDLSLSHDGHVVAAVVRGVRQG